MLNLILKKLAPQNTAGAREKAGVIACAYGIVLNTLLSASKILAGTLSGSLSMTADGLNNLSDAASNIIVIAGFRIASKKADSAHPFGHGRAEYLSAFLVAVLIVVMGLEIAKDALAKIMSPEPVEFTAAGLAVLAASVLVKLYMNAYNKKIGASIGSSAMRAAAADSLSDAVSTFFILAGALAGRIFSVNLDAWFALAVSGYILWSGYKAVSDASSLIVGAGIDRDAAAQVAALVGSCDKVLGMHDLIIHDYGPGKAFISLHAEVDSRDDLLVLHDVIDGLEERIAAKLGCVAVIHMDPLQVDNPVVTSTREALQAIIGQVAEGMRIHDFRMVTGPTHSNLIFDVEVPYSMDIDDTGIRDKINAAVSGMDPAFRAVFKLERSLTGA